MGPRPQSDGHDTPRLIGEAVPCEAAMVEDVVVGFEDAVRQPVVAHELPDVFDGVQLGASGRQRHEGVLRDNQDRNRIASLTDVPERLGHYLT